MRVRRKDLWGGVVSQARIDHNRGRRVDVILAAQRSRKERPVDGTSRPGSVRPNVHLLHSCNKSRSFLTRGKDTMLSCPSAFLER